MEYGVSLERIVDGMKETVSAPLPHTGSHTMNNLADSRSAPCSKPLGVIAESAFVLVLIYFANTYATANYNHIADDSFITYRYAQNLELGYGLVFNIDEKYFGSTAMGIAVLYAAISFLADTVSAAWAGYPLWPAASLIPKIAVWTSAVSIAAIAWVIFKISSRLNGPILAGAVVGAILLYAFPAPFTNQAAGHETHPFVALMCLGAYLLFFLKRPAAAGVILAIATTFRPDTGLFFLLCLAVTILSNWHDRKQRLQAASRIAIAYSVILVPWLLFCWIYFGQPLPGTLVAKQAQVVIGQFPAFTLSTAFTHMKNDLRPYIFGVLSLSLCAALLLGYLRTRNTEPQYSQSPLLHFVSALLLFAAIQLVLYHVIKVSFWRWYVLPATTIYFIAGTLSAIYLISAAVSEIRLPLRIASMAALIVGAILAWNQHPQLVHQFNHWVSTGNYNGHTFSYDPIVEFLKKEEASGTMIATAEPGALGFKLGPSYKTIDVLGLSSPVVAKRLIEKDFDYPFYTFNPKYVIISWGGIYDPHRRPWFDKAYELIGEFHHPYWQNALKRGAYLYRRIGSGFYNADGKSG